MNPAVHAFEQDRVHLGAEFLDARHDAHAELFAQLPGVSLHAGRTRFKVRTAALEGRHHFPAVDMFLGLGIVQDLGEGDDMRSVETNHPEAQILRGSRSGGEEHESESGERSHDHHSITAAAQVSPAPNTTISTRSPRCKRPSETASSKAMATEAAEVLPYLSRFTKT